MAHRNGSGQKFEDIEAARTEWKKANRTVTTYPNKGEFNAWEEDFGELVEAFPNGLEVRQHATIKTHARGGSPKIVHNCVIVGNPEAYQRWLADQRTNLEKGWYPRWTFYPCRDLEEQLEQCREGVQRRPVSVKCIEGVTYEIP